MKNYMRKKYTKYTKTLVQYLRILRKYDKNQVKQIPTNKYTVCTIKEILGDKYCFRRQISFWRKY